MKVLKSIGISDITWVKNIEDGMDETEEATDYTCYLVFWYDHYRNLERNTASFAGRSPTSEEWKEMTKGVRYAAEIKISFILAQKDL